MKRRTWLILLAVVALGAVLLASDEHPPHWDLDAEGIVHREVDADLLESYTFTVIGADEQLKLIDVDGIMLGLEGLMIIRGVRTMHGYVVCEAEGVKGDWFHNSTVRPCPRSSRLDNQD